MKKFLRTALVLFWMLLGSFSWAGDSAVVRFEINAVQLNEKEQLLSIKAIVSPAVKLYGLKQASNEVLFSSISFDSAFNQHLDGAIQETGSKLTELDASVAANVSYYTDTVLWQQKLAISANDSFVLKGTINYFYKKNEEYVPGEHPFKIHIAAQRPATGNAAITAAGNNDADKSPYLIFLMALGAGILAIFTPCIFSMIPVTVSFFTKRSKTVSEGRKNAVYYAASIISIYTLIGAFITIVYGPAALNNIATNWVVNLFFFALFLVFGISFLGAFEIALPSSWSTKADSKASTKNFMGIFFMALTLVIVSFSCTVPIIGLVVVDISKGNYWGPLIGMLGFSTGLALPFALFAFFPSKLNMLGKAGGWLNAVKVTLGFLELALALKFLSNADLAKGWRLLDREIFIAAWIVIFILLGIYLLGKLKFHHDDELPKNDFGLPYLSVKRLFFAMASLIFAVYMIPGLWGAPLKGISAFVPPMGTQDFNASAAPASHSNGANNIKQEGLPHPTKYYEQMKIYEPEVVTKYGMVTYFDYKEALEVARKLKKPLMLDFTGAVCVNCRKMEGHVWSDPEVMKRLKEDFVIASLFMDVHKIELPLSEQYFSKASDKDIETIGDKNADFQITKFGSNTMPYYFFLDANENKLVGDGYGYDSDISKFIQLLDKAKEEYKKRTP